MDTLNSINNMALLLQDKGELSEPEPLYREALAGSRRVLGDDHPNTLRLMNNIGRLLQAQGKRTEAESLLREALERRRRVLGNDHPDTLNSIGNMGLLLQAQGKLSEAERLYREAVAGAVASGSLGAAHPDTKHIATNHAKCLDDLGRHDEAAEVRKRFGLPDPATQPATVHTTAPASQPATQ